MYATTISTKYQVVIPLEIRKQFGLKPGRKVFYATARTFHAILWTQDAHFAGLEGIEFIEKKK